MSNLTLELTWTGSLPSLVACLENGTPEGKTMAREELSRMAHAADAAVKCQRFFEVAMPKMNIANSALDAEAIDAWNQAELAVARQKNTP